MVTILEHMAIKHAIYKASSFLCAAPTGSPQNVRNTTVTSSAISVQWDEVPCIKQNSDITGYTVQYRQTSSSGSETVEGRGNYTITGLTPFSSYSIRIAAVNSDGDSGPLSDSITVETLQDGKLYTSI